MTKLTRLVFLSFLCTVLQLLAQESPTPPPTETPSPSPTGSASTSRSVPLRFVPPPMEGTISLGIWDSNDKLVRVLHREAKIDKFTVEENSLSTTWDGKNDAGEDLPAGRYRARGYLVGNLQSEPISDSEPPPEAITNASVSIKLVTNPLVSDTRSVAELGAGFDKEATFIKTMDGLPLYTIDEKEGVVRTAIKKNTEKSVDVWEEGGGPIVQFRVSNIDKIMAFDCGFFELK